MVETARQVGFPLMAGSSLPMTWRRPELELPLGVRIEGALVGIARRDGDLRHSTLWSRCSAWWSGAAKASRASRR